MNGSLADRLMALAEIHDGFAARANFKGNAKYPANLQITTTRAHHEHAASDLREAAGIVLVRPSPHEVAEEIAKAIEPKTPPRPYSIVASKRQALHWAASVARSLFPRPE